MSVHWNKGDGNTFVHCRMCSKTPCNDRLPSVTAGCVRGTKDTKVTITKTKTLIKNEVSS